ncbi:MAG: hypothetical protein AB1476_00455 [Candidatus Hadarchaeota archaeon]
MERKGFRYNTTKETITNYAGLSARQKLEWLEEANRFFYNSMSQSKRKIMEKFRSGKI